MWLFKGRLGGRLRDSLSSGWGGCVLGIVAFLIWLHSWCNRVLDVVAVTTSTVVNISS